MVQFVNKDKREVPPEFSSKNFTMASKSKNKKKKDKSKHREICSSMFGFHEDEMTLSSYVPKKNKVVLMLSTMHYDNSIDDSTGGQKKPEILTFYNMTKGGVDVVDQLCSNYSVGRACNRWPLTILYCMLDIAGINSQVIYESNQKEDILRRNYLRTLGKIIYCTSFKINIKLL